MDRASNYLTILNVTTGSNLYGTTTPNSDIDTTGIFIADELCYFGMDSVEEIDTSTISKHSNGKNTKEAIDSKLYEIKKFFKLAIDNNPNILDILLVNEQNINFINDYGKTLLAHKHLFPWKGAKQRFLGFAFSQKHKMHIKKDNIALLRVAYDYFTYELEGDYITGENKNKYANKLLAEYRDSNLDFIKFHTNNCEIADLMFNLKVKVKDVVVKLQNRIDKFGSRTELIDTIGFDSKFGSNLIRLMFEGIELLKTGNIEFPLKERNLLLDIKQGKYTLEQVIKMSDDLEEETVQAEKDSKLPSKPRYDEINRLLINLIRSKLCL